MKAYRSDMNEPNQEGPWEVERAASYLGVSKQTLYKLAREERVPCYRVGRLLFFEPSLLWKWKLAGGTSNEARVVAVSNGHGRSDWIVS